MPSRIQPQWVNVSFTREEGQLLRQLAELRDITTSQLIREALGFVPLAPPEPDTQTRPRADELRTVEPK